MFGYHQKYPYKISMESERCPAEIALVHRSRVAAPTLHALGSSASIHGARSVALEQIATTPADMPPPHILVVDDEQFIREEIVEYLQIRGLNAQAVSNGHDALTCLRADRSVTVVLSDIRMPEMDGLTLAACALAIAGEEHAIEVALLTGHATVGDAAAATRLRAIDFLEKPLALAELKTAVMRAHRSAAARRALWREMRALENARIDAQRAIDTLVTDREQLREQLTRSPAVHGQPRRDTFMAVMNHELRTPLVPIIGLAELIEDGPETLSAKQVKDFAREIRLGGLRLERALSRITEFANLVSDDTPFNRAPCRPDRILQAVRQSSAARLNERRQTLTLDVRTRSALNANSDRLQRLLDELIDNASRFSPVASAIVVTVRDDGEGIAFSVADRGSGMTRAETDQAVNAFHQIDMSLARRFDGLGIGLPMAMRIAQRIGGRLEIESEPGNGTTVTVHLPPHSVLSAEP